MAYTGSDLYNDLKIRVYQGGAGAFLNTNRANYIIWTAVKTLIEKKYNSLIKQSSLDEINKIVKVDQPFTHNGSGVISLKPLEISAITLYASNVYQITFNRPHNLPASGTLFFEGLNGTPGSQLNNQNKVYSYLSETGITVFNTGASIASYTQGTGYALMDTISSVKNVISDYYHLLAVAIYGFAETPIKIKSVDTTLSRIVLKSNNIRSGELMYFMLPGTSLAQSGYVKILGKNIIELYTTPSFTTKVTWTGTYTTGGVVCRYMERYAEPSPSDMKISPYEPTEYFPLYQVSENELSVLPVYYNDMLLKVDYISSLAEINVTDTTNDLLQVFNLTFINEVIELAANKFFAITSSPQDVQITAAINQP